MKVQINHCFNVSKKQKDITITVTKGVSASLHNYCAVDNRS